MRPFFLLSFFLAISTVLPAQTVFSNAIVTGHSGRLPQEEKYIIQPSGTVKSEFNLDSLEKAHRGFKPLAFLFGSGYRHDYKYKKEYIEFSSLLKSAFYNTVEGFGMNYGISYTRITDTIDTRSFRLTARGRYGFSNRMFNPLLSADIPVGHVDIGFIIGADVENLNDQHPMAALANTINSLIYERNYLKLFQKKTAAVSIQGRLYRGIKGSAYAGWESRKWLSNTSDYKWRNVKKREFTFNNPFSPASEEPLFPTNQSFKFSISLSYDFSDKYVSYPAGKYYLPSKFPLLTARYTQAVKNIFGADVNYSLLELNVSRQNIPLGIYGKSSFYAGAGKFLSSSNLYFTDFKHFNGNRIFSYQPEQNKFIFLDYYRFSTSEKYVEGHFMHNFSGLFLSKFPLLKRFKLQETAGINYLGTPALKNYTEIYAGLSYLNITAQYGVSFTGQSRNNSGVRIAVRL